MASFKHLPPKVRPTVTGHFSESRTQILLAALFLLSLLLVSSSLTNQSPLILASAFADHLFSAANLLPHFTVVTPSNTCLVSDSHTNCSLSSISGVEKRLAITPVQNLASCDIFNGRWVAGRRRPRPLYPPGSCPFVDDSFDCFKNGRPDSGYLRYRWKPFGCRIPRFNGKRMLRMLRRKRVVFVGDSLNRNMWESLVCALRESLKDKRRVFEVSGRREFKSRGLYSFKFRGYKCSIDFIKSPFLVQESGGTGAGKETLNLDKIQASSSNSIDADIIIFNSAHWWTHHRAFKGKNYFQERGKVYKRLEVTEAYTKALKTWAKWVDSNIDSNRTRVFFRGYSASHFRKGKWNTGGRCDGETWPISNETALAPYPRMMEILESVISGMKTPVTYMNITKMTAYRRDGHPSIFRAPEIQRKPGMVQDCSHWCLPGVPDSWNELLYATLLISRLNPVIRK